MQLPNGGTTFSPEYLMALPPRGQWGERSGLGVKRPGFPLYNYAGSNGSIALLSSVSSCVIEEVEIVGLRGSFSLCPWTRLVERTPAMAGMRGVSSAQKVVLCCHLVVKARNSLT